MQIKHVTLVSGKPTTKIQLQTIAAGVAAGTLVVFTDKTVSPNNFSTTMKKHKMVSSFVGSNCVFASYLVNGVNKSDFDNLVKKAESDPNTLKIDCTTDGYANASFANIHLSCISLQKTYPFGGKKLDSLTK